MRKFIAVLLLILYPQWAFCAAITSAQDGNALVGATWVGGTAPIDGDTVIVATGHDITLANGDSWAVGPDGATGTEAIQVQGTGTLITSYGSTLRVKGDLNQQRGTTVRIGGEYILDANTGVTYVWKCLTTGSGTAAAEVIGPSATSRAYVHVGTRGGIGRLNFDSSQLHGMLTHTNAKFEGLGSASVRALDHYLFPTAGYNRATNVLWLNCGMVAVAFQAGDDIVDWNGVDIRGTIASTYGLQFLGANDNTTGTRSVKNLTVYNTTAKDLYFTARDLSVDGFYMHNSALTTNNTAFRQTYRNVWKSNDVVVGWSAGPNITQTIDGAVSLMHSANQHHFGETGTTGGLTANIYKNILFDGDNYFNTDAGDCVIPVGSAAVEKCININDAGTLATLLNSSAILTATNNTSYDSYGIAVGETVGGASQMLSAKNNLFVSQNDGLHQNSAFASQTSFSLDYNAFWDMKTAGNLDLSGNNSYMGAQTYSNWFASGAYGDSGKGLNDKYLNPEFINPGWTVRSYGGWASVQDAGREMVTINGIAYDGTATTATTKTTAKILDSGKAAFTPKNMLLLNAGEAGTYAGAAMPIPGGAAMGVGM